MSEDSVYLDFTGNLKPSSEIDPNYLPDAIVVAPSDPITVVSDSGEEVESQIFQEIMESKAAAQQLLNDLFGVQAQQDIIDQQAQEAWDQSAEAKAEALAAIEAIFSDTPPEGSAIAFAIDLAAAKGKTLTQSEEPDVADRLPQNLWIDTTAGANTPKYWNGSAWVAVHDGAISTAKVEAIAAAASDATSKAAAAKAEAIAAAELTAEEKADLAEAAAIAAAATDATTKAATAKSEAIAAAELTAATKAATAKSEAIAAAELTAEEKADLAQAAAITAAASDAASKAATAKSEAIAAAASDATSKANAARTAAEAAAATHAEAEAEAARLAAIAAASDDADDKAAAAQAAAIAAAAADAASKASAAQTAAATDAATKAATAKSEAIAAAALTAQAKADAAQAAAATDAATKAATAKSEAIAAAASDATAKVSTAKAEAIAAAAADAATKAATAKSEAISAAALTAQEKADLAKAEALSAAATDAASKAAAAQTAAATDATTKATNAQNAAITAANLALDKSVNLINNTSRTGTVARWAITPSTGNFATAESVDFNGRPVMALKYDATGNPQMYSDYFDVDVTKAYEVRMWVLDPTLVTGTQFYIGINTRAGAAANMATAVSRLTGVASAPSSNIYFHSTSSNTPAWTEYVAYFLPHGFTPADAKGLGKNVTSNVIFSDPATTSARIRVLNYSNGTGRRNLWLAHMTVTETTAEAITQARAAAVTADAVNVLTTGWTRTGTTSIDGGKIHADSVTAAQIAANSITTSELAANAVEAGHITAGAVIAGKLAADSVLANNIKAGEVVAGKLAANAVVAGNIVSGAVTTDKLDALAVTAAKIDALAVTAEKIAANAVEADKIRAGAVVAGKLAADSVVATNIKAGEITGDKLVANTITAAQIATGAVTADEIAANAVIAGKLAADSVLAANIKANEVVAGKLAANAVVAGNIAANAVVADKIAAGAVTAAKIDALAVTAEKIDAGAVTAIKIDTGAVTTVKLDANAVTAVKIAANAVEADKIKAGAITTVKLDANAVTAEKIAADSLDVDKLRVTGAAKIPLAVINTLVGDEAFFNRMLTERLVVAPEGLWRDADFRGNYSPFTKTTVGGGAVRLVRSGVAAAGTGAMFASTEVPAKGGESFGVSFRVALRTSYTGTVELRTEYRSSAGTWLSVPSSTVASPTTGTGEVTGVIPAIPAGATAIRFGLYTGSAMTSASVVNIDQINIQRRVGPILIENGAITAEKLNVDSAWIGSLMTAQIVAANLTAAAVNSLTLNAIDITGGTIRGATVISPGVNAGDSIRLANQALTVTRDDEGASVVTTSLGGTSRDQLVLGAGGDTGIILDGAGFGSVSGNLSVGSLTVGDVPLDTHLNTINRGVIAYSQLFTGSPQAGNSNLGYVRFVIPTQIGRQYNIHIHGMLGGTTGDTMRIFTMVNSGGSTKQINYGNFTIDGSNDHFQYDTLYNGEVNGLTSVWLWYRNMTANRGIWFQGYPTGPVQAYVEDMGPIAYNQFPALAEYDLAGGTPISGTPPAPDSTSTYTKTYATSWTRSWRGGGIVSDYLHHGYYGGYQRYSMAGFGGTLASDMTGATIIKAEVYLKNASWWSSTGDALIGTATNTSAPSSPVTSGTTATSSGWPQGAGRWVDITSLWSTSSRAITLGVGAGTSTSRYGKFSNSGVQLRVTYRK